MTAWLKRHGHAVNRKRIRRLMRLMGIEAIDQKPNTSGRALAHKVHPYPLRGLAIERVNQVWCADITYIPMARGFLYLVAIGSAGIRSGLPARARRRLQGRTGHGEWIDFCNTERPHSALAGRTPAEAYGAGRPVDTMDKPGGLPTSPQAQQQQQDVIIKDLAA